MTIFRPVQKIDANWLTPGLCSRLARLLGLLVLLAGVPALAAVFKWVDDDGEIHFSDQPRAPRAVPVEVKPTLPATPSSADRNLPAALSNDPDGQLLQAVHVGDELAIGRAVHQGANVNGRHGKQIPLFVAILHEQPKALGYLIRLGADPNHTNGRDYGALHYAAERNRPGFIELLLAKGATLEQRSDGGLTPLAVATAKGNREAVEMLLQHSARVDALDFDGRTSLSHAVARSHPGVVAVLLEHGAVAGVRTPLGESLLTVAARNKDVDSLSLLLDRGIDVNARDNRGSTALLEAVRTGHVASVQLLIAHGASLQARNGKGEQVIDIARSRAWIQLYPLLQP